MRRFRYQICRHSLHVGPMADVGSPRYQLRLVDVRRQTELRERRAINIDRSYVTPPFDQRSTTAFPIPDAPPVTTACFPRQSSSCVPVDIVVVSIVQLTLHASTGLRSR